MDISSLFPHEPTHFIKSTVIRNLADMRVVIDYAATLSCFLQLLSPEYFFGKFSCTEEAATEVAAVLRAAENHTTGTIAISNTISQNEQIVGGLAKIMESRKF